MLDTTHGGGSHDLETEIMEQVTKLIFSVTKIIFSVKTKLTNLKSFKKFKFPYNLLVTDLNPQPMHSLF